MPIHAKYIPARPQHSVESTHLFALIKNVQRRDAQVQSLARRKAAKQIFAKYKSMKKGVASRAKNTVKKALLSVLCDFEHLYRECLDTHRQKNIALCMEVCETVLQSELQTNKDSIRKRIDTAVAKHRQSHTARIRVAPEIAGLVADESPIPIVADANLDLGDIIIEGPLGSVTTSSIEHFASIKTYLLQAKHGTV